MSVTRMTECRCGRSIPADWPECGECQARASLAYGTGEEAARRAEIRHMALLNKGWEKPEDPRLAAVAKGLQRLADQKAILIQRQIHRAVVGQAAVQRLYWEPDEDDS